MQPAPGLVALARLARSCPVPGARRTWWSRPRIHRAAADPEASAVGKASGRAGSTLTPPKPTVPVGLDEMAAAIPADLIDLRPEDLRVEAEFFQSLTRAPEPPNEPEPAPWAAPGPAAPFPGVETGFPAAPASSPPAIETPASAVPAHRSPPGDPSAFPSLAPTPPLLAPASPVVPPIEIEPPSLLPPNREFRPCSRGGLARVGSARLVTIRADRHRHVVHRGAHGRALFLEDVMTSSTDDHSSHGLRSLRGS